MNPTPSNTTERVRSILAAVLAEAGDDEPFADGDSMVTSGRLTSLDVVAVVSALEEAFGFELGADDFDPVFFDSVDSITALVARLQP
ncbi:MAG: acyl carrier protein [Candidatus Binatia bacterium]